ncbi:tetratricopeptide repeat protein [Streptomyces sp. TLI_053]|uniref:tetratricopeptide repeat protein n=1 Tax=Streptomyces sp. TLI_053 TaxID=1855352 RepID=UPI000B807C93
MPSRVTRSATELGEEHPDTPTACANLAASYWQAGRTEEAASLLRSVVEQRDRVLGPAHPDTVMCRVDLATVLTERGRDLLPGDTLRAWRDVAEAVQAVGPYLSGDQAGYGPVLARAYGICAAVLDADGQPEAAADFRSPFRPGDDAADRSRPRPHALGHDADPPGSSRRSTACSASTDRPDRPFPRHPAHNPSRPPAAGSRSSRALASGPPGERERDQGAGPRTQAAGATSPGCGVVAPFRSAHFSWTAPTWPGASGRVS